MRRWQFSAVAAVAGAGVVGALVAATSGGAATPKSLIVTAEVQRRTLQDKVTLNGQLGRVEQRKVTTVAAGQISQVHLSDGAIVQAGEPILAVDGRDAVAELGAFSFFRPLDVGATGEDVRQLEQILAASGYNPGPINTLYTEQTRFALAQWQAAHHYPGATPEKTQTVTVALTQSSAYKVGAQGAASVIIGPSTPSGTSGTSFQAARFADTVTPAALTAFLTVVPNPVLTVRSVNAVTNKGAPATFIVYASAASAAPVDFQVALGGTAGPDEVLPPPGPLTLPAGATSVQVQVPTRLNGLVQPDATLTLTLLSGSGYSVGTPGSANTRIVSNDVPQISLTGGGAVADGQSATVTITADQAPVQDTQIALSVGGNATPMKDYTPIAPTVMLAAGQASTRRSAARSDEAAIRTAPSQHAVRAKFCTRSSRSFEIC